MLSKKDVKVIKKDVNVIKKDVKSHDFKSAYEILSLN